jgi:3-oxoacyl-[acyl-carrier-protein] synthase II
VRIAIEGVGVVGGFGSGLQALADSLARGPAAVDVASVPAEGETLSVRSMRAVSRGLEDFVERRALRRVDHFSRLALLAACLALREAGPQPPDPKTLGVVVATGYGASRATFGFLESFVADGDALASPTHFSTSVHNAAAANIAIILGAQGPNLTVSQFEMSVASALHSARLMLLEGQAETILFGGVDESCDVLQYCRHRFFGAEDGEVMRPLDFERQTAITGEGAAFFLLRRAAEGAPSSCWIEEVALGNLADGPPRIPEDALVILGADGNRACSRHYARALRDARPVLAFSHHYGSFPTAQAMDLAVASLLLRGVVAAVAPADTVGGGAATRAGEDSGLIREAACCLKMDGKGDYGLVTLRRS